MIHDAKVEVTCDGERCTESILIDLPYVYTSLSGSGGHYDSKKETINEAVRREGWIVTYGGNHYCQGCTEKRER